MADVVTEYALMISCLGMEEYLDEDRSDTREEAEKVAQMWRDGGCRARVIEVSTADA